MPEFPARRSPRLALELSIRVYGIDYQGKDFVEDSTTLVVNRHGAKIRLHRQLIPEQEVRILCRRSNREAIFRVVSKAAVPNTQGSVWGVECRRRAADIWAVSFPELGTMDQISVRVMLQCPECHTREVMYLTEPLLLTVQELGGLVRGCDRCGKSELWKQVPYEDS